MAKRKRRSKTRHRLLVYDRLGRRLRTVPLVTALAGAGLYVLSWLAASGKFQSGNQALLTIFWEQRVMLLLLIGGSVGLYVLAVLLGRSYVEPRPKALRVRAGLIPLDISYRRIKQIRVMEFGYHYPLESLRPRERALVRPFIGYACTVVDLRSWPLDRRLLRWLWSKFLFGRDGESLLLLVEDALPLNQQIDSLLVQWQTRAKQRGYKDPIARAVEMQRKKGGPGHL